MRGFFAIGNPSGTRNACSQFSITVQNNFLSQEVQRCYWWGQHFKTSLDGRNLKCAVLSTVLMACMRRRQELTEQNLEKSVVMFKG